MRHLASAPELQRDLSLCPVYNGHSACCTAAFEEEQQRAFDRWVAHLQGKVNRIRAFHTEMEAVKMSQAFLKAGTSEQRLFDKAFASFGPVLNTYGTCFDTVLEYIAGILCFSCDPEWERKVLLDRDGSRVTGLLLDDRANVDLWLACRDLGRAGIDLLLRLADSSLAKTVRIPVEDFGVFSSKVRFAEHMELLGLLAMLGPSEHMLEVAPGSTVQRRLLAESSAGDDAGGEDNEGTGGMLDPVHDGRLSGFRCDVFPRAPIDTGAAVKGSRQPWAALAFTACVLVARR